MTVFTLTIIAMLMASTFCMYSNFRKEIKAVAIFYLIVSTLWVVSLTASYKGSPIFYKKIPPELIVYGQEIDQEEGYIHLLCREYEDGKLIFMKTPYVLEMHKALEEGRNQSKGKPFKMNRGEKGEGGEGKEGGKGKGKGGQEGDGTEDGEGGQGSLSHQSDRYWSGPLPRTQLPQKGPNGG